TRMSKPKQPFNKPLPRTDHIELSPEKSDVGQAKHIVKTINPDISHYVLAEIGSDMGQLIKVKELVNPDISHLDLADNTEASG
ncbi:MAG: hypothetical protein GY829_04320, partial [Gammaproteobacteria bacterium]|nr:hypothetical protein [Gammaproteobacteria bacterium]